METGRSENRLSPAQTLGRIRRLIAEERDKNALVDGFCRILCESTQVRYSWAAFTDPAGNPVDPFYHAGLGSDFQPMAQLLKKKIIPDCGRRALDGDEMVLIDTFPGEYDSCLLKIRSEDEVLLSCALQAAPGERGWICCALGRDDELIPFFEDLTALLETALENLRHRLQGQSLEANMQDLLDGMGDAVLELDRNLKLVGYNDAALSLLGDSLKERLGRTPEELMNLQNYRLLEEACFGSLRGEDRKNAVLTIRDWNGDPRKVLPNISLRRDRDGEVFGYYILLKDQRDRDTLLQTLKEREKSFINLFERTPAGYQSLDENGYFLDVNGQWLKTLGYEKDEVIGRWFGDFLVPSYKDAFRERFPLFKEKGRIHSEFEMIHKDGRIRFIAFEGRIGYREDGSFQQTHCLLTDITEKRQAEESLRQNQLYFKSLFGLLNSGITILEPDSGCRGFRIRDMNPAGQLINRLNLDDVKGRLLSEVLPGIGEMGLEQLIISCCESGESQYLPLTRYSDSRISEYVEYYIDRIPTGEIMLIYDDRTPQVRMEKRVRQAEKMEAIGQLAGGIAHDFNNILTGIMGYTELIRMKSSGEPELGSYLEKIEGAGNRAKKLVQQILSFSRQEPDRQELFSIRTVLEETGDFLRSAIPASVSIEMEPGEKSAIVEGDPSKIREILINLGSNASAAMNDSGTLTISLDEEILEQSREAVMGRMEPGPYAVLSVSDTGCGMSGDMIDRIFEPFFTTRPVGEGTGMGLSVVFGIVKNHGGNIKVSSVPGEGTSFVLYFPILHDASDEQSKIPETAGPAQLVIVDDEHMNCFLYQNLLENMGYRVEGFTEAEKALEWLRSRNGRADLMITDQSMPEMTGTALCRAVKESWPELPVLICSGFSREVDETNFAEFGASGFIPKPFDLKTLGAAVAKALA